MRVQDFPRTVDKLGRKNVKWADGKVVSLEYGLSGEGLGREKYYPIRKTVFTLRVLSPEHFRVLVDGEPFQDAFSPEDIRIVLTAAFDQACIHGGIDSAAAKFKTTGQEENMVRRRGPNNSTAFARFKTSGMDDAVFAKRATSKSTAFDKFKTAAREDNVFRKRQATKSTAFDKFKTAGQEENLVRRRDYESSR